MLKNNIFLIKKYSSVFLLIFFIHSVFFFCKQKEEKKRIITRIEFFFFIDTSGSMAGKTFLQIKKKFSEFYSLFREGDIIYIASFDEKPILQIKIESYQPASTPEQINSIIDNLKPVGQYTDFRELISFIYEVLNQADQEFQKYEREFQNQRDKPEIKRKQFIIVLTDGIDDPKEKRKRIDIGQYKSQETLSVVDKYVYYLNFANQKSETLEKDLKTITPQTKVMEQHPKSDEKSEKSEIISEVKEDITENLKTVDKQNTNFQKLMMISYFLNQKLLMILSVPILFLIFILFLLKFFFTRPFLKGEIIFYEAGMHPSTGKTVKLDRFEHKNLTIGTDYSCLIRIKSNDFPSKIIFKAKQKKESFYFKVPSRFINQIQFLVQKTPKIIQPGDKFKINNYIFEYGYVNKKL